MLYLSYLWKSIFRNQPYILLCRAAHSLWAESLYEYQCVDVSSDMGNLARVLMVGGEIPLQEPHPPTPEDIPGVHFRQYLPLSNKVLSDHYTDTV